MCSFAMTLEGALTPQTPTSLTLSRRCIPWRRPLQPGTGVGWGGMQASRRVTNLRDPFVAEVDDRVTHTRCTRERRPFLTDGHDDRGSGLDFW